MGAAGAAGGGAGAGGGGAGGTGTSFFASGAATTFCSGAFGGGASPF